MRVAGFPQCEPIASTRSKSGSIRTWSSSARGARPMARDAPVVGARARPLRRRSGARTAVVASLPGAAIPSAREFSVSEVSSWH